MRLRWSSSESVAAADLAPTTRLRWYAPGSPGTQNGSDGGRPCQSNQRPSQKFHKTHPNEPRLRCNQDKNCQRGASWIRTSDLTLIRGAL